MSVQVQIHVQVLVMLHKIERLAHIRWPQIPGFFPDPSTRSGVFERSDYSSAISSFIMKCYGDRSNTGLKSFTASVLYIIISDCRQIILIQRRCYSDRKWVSVAACINGNKAVTWLPVLWLDKYFVVFQPLIGWISCTVSEPMEAGAHAAKSRSAVR